MHRFKNLKIWQESMELTVEVYKITSEFPQNEKYGLTSQIRRAAISISSNIAEGSSRNSNKDFSRFLSISLGSAFELETQLIIANKLHLIDEKSLKNIITSLSEIQKMIIGFQNKLNNNYTVNEVEEIYYTSKTSNV